MTFQERITLAFETETARRRDLGLERLTKKVLWMAAGKSSASATHWFNGANGADLATCMKLAQELKVNPYWLYDGSLAPEAPWPPHLPASDLVGLEIPEQPRGKVPLISWVRAGELCESPDNFQPGDAEVWLDCPVKHGPRTYCLRINGDSMDNGTADGYRDGEIIFVDPDIDARPGSDVVARTPDGKATFKRLKQDQDGYYLLALNGMQILRVPEGTVFCGVTIFSGMVRR